MSLLRPLLSDEIESIQQSAALALGSLASYSDSLAEEIVTYEILPKLVDFLKRPNVTSNISLTIQENFKKSAAFVLRAVAKHSPALASAVVEYKALDALVACLEEFLPEVKKNAAWALSYIAKHNEELAGFVYNAGAIPLLVLCIQEPEDDLKKIAASALSEICKHSEELANRVVEQKAITFLIQLTNHKDTHIKRQICSCLAQIAKHSEALAKKEVDQQVIPRIFPLLKDQDNTVKKNAATCIREIAKQSGELADKICGAGGGTAIVEYISETTGNDRLPGIMCLGYIATYNETSAATIISAKCIPHLRDALIKEKQSHIKAAAAWTLGQLGSHSESHAKAMAENDVPRDLLMVVIV